MRSLLANRLITAPIVLFAVSWIAFLMPQLTGADPVRAVLRARTTEAAPDPQTLERLSAELGLDRPLVVRYLDFASDALTGDFGLSFVTRTPVVPQLVVAAKASLLLIGLTLAVAVAGGVALGVLAAAQRGRWPDRLVTATSQLGATLPEFVLGPALVLLLAVWGRMLPASGWGTAAHTVLPVVSLAAFPCALIAQLVRAEVLDALTQPFVLAARAKGLPPRRVLWAHVLRGALTTVTATTNLFLVGLLGGAIVVEVIFAVPGLGRLLYAASLDNDLPTFQAGIMVVVAVALAAGFVADLVQLLIDPRLRGRARRR